MAQKIKSISSHKYLYILVIVLGIVLVGGFFFWKHDHDQKLREDRKVIPTNSSSNSHSSSASSKAVQGSVKSPSVSSGSSSNTSSPTQQSTDSAGASLTSAPSGTFVSNHSPNLSGSPAPSQEQSVCNTVPGATCTIVFTNGSKTKQLATQTADNNGVVVWNWDVNQAGFTPGSWKITATATLGNSSLSTADSRSLDVQP